MTSAGALGATVSGSVTLTVAGSPTLPAVSVAVTAYATVAPGARPVSVKPVAAVEPIVAPSRATL